MKEIVLTGPNLQLDDLRWLVDRCQDLPGKTALRVEAAQPTTPDGPRYPRIVIEDDTRRLATRAGQADR